MKPRLIPPIFAAVVACVLSGCDREKSNKSLYGRKISDLEVRYIGDNTVEEKRLRTLITSKPGDRFTIAAIDLDVKALYESGLVDEVRFLSEPDGDAVRLIAEVSTRTPFGPPFCIGNTAYSDKSLAEASGLTTERPITTEGLEKARLQLKAFYVGRGYLDAEVTCRAFQGGDPSPEDYVFVVDEGATVPQASTGEKEAQQAGSSNGG